jgi:hypothetical protein
LGISSFVTLIYFFKGVELCKEHMVDGSCGFQALLLFQFQIPNLELKFVDSRLGLLKFLHD